MGIAAPADNGNGFQNQSWTWSKYDSGGHQTFNQPGNGSFRLWQTYKSPNQNGGYISLGGDSVFRLPTSFLRRVRQWNLSTSTEVITNPDGSSEHRGGFAIMGDLNDTPSWFLGDSSNIEAQAVTDCLNRLNQGKVQLGQYLAESVKSADMLARTSSELVNALLQIRRGNLAALLAGAKDAVRNADNIYLEYKYGYRPLVQDIYNLFKQSRDGLARPNIIKAQRVVSTTQQGYTDCYLSRNGKAQFNIQMTSRCGLWAKMSSAYLANAQTYGLANPLSLGWELIPYSFVVDWVLPVGNYLSALSATIGLDFIAGYKGTTREGSVEFESNFQGHVSQPFFEYSRIALSGFPHAELYASENPFRTSNVVSALALFTQLLH